MDFDQMLFFERINPSNRDIINEFIRRRWYSTTMVVRGKEYDMTAVQGFFLREEGSVIGLITYTVYDDTLEILSLDSLLEKRGIGTKLLENAIDEARARGCRQVTVITTNDNIYAIRFYQKRGFDLANLYHDALEESRKLKPEIPLIGENGIPLRHELEFILTL